MKESRKASARLTAMLLTGLLVACAVASNAPKWWISYLTERSNCSPFSVATPTTSSQEKTKLAVSVVYIRVWRMGGKSKQQVQPEGKDKKDGNKIVLVATKSLGAGEQIPDHTQRQRHHSDRHRHMVERAMKCLKVCSVTVVRFPKTSHQPIHLGRFVEY